MELNTKRTWAEVRLGNIASNLRAIRATLPAGTKFLGVVKADAYGHGAVQVSHCLQEIGAEYLAVSCLDEALELRFAGIRLPILILGHTPPEYVPTLIAEHLTQTVTNRTKAEEYDAQAARGISSPPARRTSPPPAPSPISSRRASTRTSPSRTCRARRRAPIRRCSSACSPT